MTADNITEVDVWQLAQAVAEFGKYSFLIGAGTSRPKPASILTASGLIDIWQEECFDHASPELDIDEWIQEQEKSMDYDQNEYGFWFEKRHPTRGERRKRIDELVRDADPTPAHITLASMMSEGYVPHVLTPNFDDLLFDAFYLFLEDKPNLIDHRAVAPEFKLTRDDPAIVKLHGDYLYDNLQNTDSETEALEPAMKDALQKTVTEYGLVVVGYGGTDDSIMDPLLDADISEHGIYWCVRDTESISPKVGELLEKSNTYLVQIDGFLSLMETFYNHINDVELPKHDELIERAEQRADLLQGALRESQESSNDEIDGAFEEVLDQFAAQRAIENDHPSHALELLDEGSDPVSSSLRGRAKNSLGRYEGAIEDITQAIEHRPNNSADYYNRGIVYDNLDQFENAIEDYTQALELDPEDISAYHNRGVAKIELGRYEEAIEDFSKAIDLDPDDVSLYTQRGRAKLNLEQDEKAIEDFTKAIEVDPEDASPYFKRGAMKVVLGREGEAIEDLDRAIELDPEHPDAYTSRGVAKIGLDRAEEAVEDLDRAIELDPENATAYSYRGVAERSLGQTEQAFDDLDRGIELGSEEAMAYANRGSLKFDLERHEGAIEDLNKAIELDPENSELYSSRGVFKLESGQHEAAIEDLEKSIELNSDYTHAQKNLSEAKILVGEYEEAKEIAESVKDNSTSTEDLAISQLTMSISKIASKEESDDVEEELRTICEKEFSTTWDFTQLDSWLEEGELEPSEKEQISELISLVRDHQEEG